MPTVLKSESLSLLEPSGPVQACNGFDVPLSFFKFSLYHNGHVPLSTPDYTSVDYQVGGLSVHDRNVTVTSDEGSAKHQCRPGLPVLQDYGSYLFIFLGTFIWTKNLPITKSSRVLH